MKKSLLIIVSCLFFAVVIATPVLAVAFEEDECDHAQGYNWSYNSSNHWALCKTCGFQVIHGIHSVSSSWSHNSSQHWKKCSAGCGFTYSSTYGNHRWQAVGNASRVCLDCGRYE